MDTAARTMSVINYEKHISSHPGNFSQIGRIELTFLSTWVPQDLRRVLRDERNMWEWLKDMAAGLWMCWNNLWEKGFYILWHHEQFKRKFASASINNETLNFACMVHYIYQLFAVFSNTFSFFFIQSDFDFSFMTVWNFLWWCNFVQLLKPAPQNVISLAFWLFSVTS